ncbi:MAG: ankyrin repeat domain-containing protein [Xanthomonadales bacterium]|nr:ankyrin repeat domain-containing protein [Xanthomonadales bacterium]
MRRSWIALGVSLLGFAAAILLPMMSRHPPRSGQPDAAPALAVAAKAPAAPVVSPGRAAHPPRKRPSPEGEALFQARGDREKIRALLAEGVDIDALNQVGWTALEGAVIDKDVERIRFLLDAGADPNARNADGDTALGSVSCVDLRSAELLIERGAQVDIADDVVHYTPLHHCADRGEVAVIELLIAHGAEVDAARKDGSTPLHDAAEGGRREAVSALLRHGASPVLRDDRQRTPLFRALDRGVNNVIDLLAVPEAIDIPNDKGTTALMRAIYNDDELSARWLVEHGADVRLASHSGETALHVAAGYASVDLVRFLLDEGAEVNAADSFGGSALDRAEFKHHEDIAALLIERGAHVDKYRCVERFGGGTRVHLRRGGCPAGQEATRLPG